MTISRVEVIASVERRRRWSQDEKEQLVAASLEPGASVSEVARMAGLHVSQLFRWRKELCKHGEASIAPFVPVEIGPSVPPREVAEAPLTTAARRRRKSLGIIEIDLGSGVATETLKPNSYAAGSSFATAASSPLLPAISRPMSRITRPSRPR